jgi:hypothetical protein
VSADDRPGIPLLGVEPYLEGSYRKHNCSTGWLPPRPRSTPQAFSHFTYCASAGRMMVVDVQGVDDRYTDPVVLTADGLGFGLGNVGRRGMDAFFASHRCNGICRRLGLPPRVPSQRPSSERPSSERPSASTPTSTRSAP